MKQRCITLLVLAACGSRTADHTTTDAEAADTTHDTSSGGGDAAPSLAPIMPLVVGYRWDSSQTTSGAGGPTTTCTQVHTVTGQIAVDGRNAFINVFDTTCPSQPTQSFTMYTAPLGNDRYESRNATATDGIWYLYDTPSEGHQWTSDPAGMFLFTWHAVPAITVPAGTFTDCWRAVTLVGGSDQEATWCRGVGLVATDDTFSTGYMLHGTLAAKSF